MLTAGIGTLTLLLRAYRWRILLNAEGRVSIPTVFWATAAGYFGNNFLPARAGELVRTFLISTRSGLEPAYVLATALSERVADAVALVAIGALVLLTLPSPPGWLAGVVGRSLFSRSVESSRLHYCRCWDPSARVPSSARRSPAGSGPN